MRLAVSELHIVVDCEVLLVPITGFCTTDRLEVTV